MDLFGLQTIVMIENCVCVSQNTQDLQATAEQTYREKYSLIIFWTTLSSDVKTFFSGLYTLYL